MAAVPVDAESLLAHGAFVRAVARAMLGATDAEVEDVVQDTWSAALASKPREPGRLRSWLGGIARRQAALRIRARTRARRHLPRAFEREGRRRRPLDPHSASVRAETGRRLVEAVLALPEPYRDVVLLRYLEELPPRVVARELGLPVETVRTRARRALARLRADLDDTRRPGSWRYALLPLAGGLAREGSASSVGVAGGTVVSKKVVITAAGLVLAALGGWRIVEATRRGDALPSGSAAKGAGLPAVPAPVLKGAADAAERAAGEEREASRLAASRDYLDLVRRIWRSEAARDRLTVWGREDPVVVERLVAWLEPRHDHERRLSRDETRVEPGYWFDITRVFGILAAIGPSTVDVLVAALDHADEHMRERAVHALAFQGASAVGAVPALTALLEDVSDPLVPHVLGALGNMGPVAREALPVFTALLRDAHATDTVAAVAAKHLLRIVEPTPDVIETLRIALRIGSYEVCRELLPWIRDLGERAEPLTGELHQLVLDPETHGHVRDDALEALARLSAGRAGIEATMLRIVADADEVPATRGAAARALVRLGSDGRAALLRTARTLRDEERILVVEGLARRGVPEDTDLAAFLALLDPVRAAADPELRVRAIEAAEPWLDRAGADVAWAARWMTDSDAAVRCRALRALEWGSADAAAVLAVAYDALGDPEPGVRRMAFDVILERSASYEDAPVREIAPARLTAVAQALADDDRIVRMSAARLLRRLDGRASTEAISVYVEMLASVDPGTVLVAADALARLGAKARESAPALRRAREKARWAYLCTRLDEALAAVAREEPR